MPARCRVCDHPRLQEINADLISGAVSLRDAVNKYKTETHNVSYSGLRYHKKHHLQQEIDKVVRKRAIATQDTAMKTIDALDLIINRIPEIVEHTTLNAAIRALELRARITGEEARPPRILIEWGLPFDAEYFERIQKQYEEMKTVEAEYRVIPHDPRDDEYGDRTSKIKDGATAEIV